MINLIFVGGKFDVFRVEAPTNDHLRDYAQDLEKYKVARLCLYIHAGR
jgi:hypothetical protein